MRPDMDRNKHVKDYLTYYVLFSQPPRFAVLVNGSWGIGKTFLLKEFLRHLENEVKYVYVSLHGLTSLDEIDDALFRATYPLLDNRGVKIAGRVIKTFAKNFRIDPDLKIKDVMNRANADLFVFDDLERCDVPVNRVLGYINDFVEHEDRKVIIVANEKEIKGSEDYGRIREKLVGKTLEIQSVLEQALEALTARVDDASARTFLASKANEIAEIYRQSELNNLRILQQTMWDFERFYRAVADKHRQNDRAMTSLMRTLFGLSFELKAGRLGPEHLSGRVSAYMSWLLVSERRDDTPAPPFVLALRQYPSSNLADSALSDETVADMLVKGIVDGEKIRAELDVSSHYVTIADEPAWRTVWYAFERTEEKFQSAIAEMERAYAAREYARTGEILHIFGLRLWLSEIGVLPTTRADVVVGGRRYIDDLYAAKRIEPIPTSGGACDIRHSGYGGLQIREHETEEYRELYAYLHEKRRAAEIDHHPEQASELLATMVADPDLFWRRVGLVQGEENSFYSVPVLATLDPDAFATAFLDHHPASQRTVLNALKSRYEHGHLDRELAAERPWAIAVRSKLLQATGGMSPIGRHRMQKLLEWTLDEVLGSEAQQPQS
jgi:hypothetical protein